MLGVDRDRLRRDDTLPAACMAALEEHGVLVFRELQVDDETQIAFSKQLDDVGKAEPAPLPSIYVVSLDPAKSRTAAYTRGTFHWHIDGAQDDVPTKATTLSARAVAASGGETEFASTYAAYDDLSEAEKQQFAHLRVVHSFEASQRLVNPDPSPEELARWREKPDKEHPLIWRHRSGRHSLVIGVSAAGIVGMDEASRKRRFWATCWRGRPCPSVSTGTSGHSGDLVIWDNTGVMHRACPYDPSSAREMHRTTMSGDEPIR